MKNIIRDELKIQFELVTPVLHMSNDAEVAIRNFKAHLLSVLAGVADDFPLQLWDRLLSQIEITINLIRQSNATPKVSAYAHLIGPFDYKNMPLDPMGCDSQVHEKKDKRCTWHTTQLMGGTFTPHLSSIVPMHVTSSQQKVRDSRTQ